MIRAASLLVVMANDWHSCCGLGVVIGALERKLLTNDGSKKVSF